MGNPKEKFRKRTVQVRVGAQLVKSEGWGHSEKFGQAKVNRETEKQLRHDHEWKPEQTCFGKFVANDESVGIEVVKGTRGGDARVSRVHLYSKQDDWRCEDRVRVCPRVRSVKYREENSLGRAGD